MEEETVRKDGRKKRHNGIFLNVSIFRWY
uniref:Uncharacterized protein n=1 Tax=Arundo donax TaxID=35708 RepID=A0A0A8ZC08_ARUDO